jgi:hypothetical protein
MKLLIVKYSLASCQFISKIPRVLKTFSQSLRTKIYGVIANVWVEVVGSAGTTAHTLLASSPNSDSCFL